MTDIENRKKALALLNEVRAERGLPAQYGLPFYSNPFSEALCRAIEQHEAFRQEVSDALYVYQKADSLEERSLLWDALTRFIIAKPDPLVEAWIEATGNTVGMEPLNEALAKRGGKIVWEND